MICCLNKTVRRSQTYGALLAIQHAHIPGADTSPSFSVKAPPSSAPLKKNIWYCAISSRDAKPTSNSENDARQTCR